MRLLSRQERRRVALRLPLRVSGGDGERCDWLPAVRNTVAVRSGGQGGMSDGRFKICHGGRRSIEYKSWIAMKSRCCYSKHPHYADYAGRGVTVCERWLHSFADFLADVGRKPSTKHTLDRYPNNDGNYEPGNVRWATASEQAHNRRDNRKYTHDGETLTVREWARKMNTNHATLNFRIKRGWPIEKVFSIPVGSRGARYGLSRMR